MKNNIYAFLLGLITLGGEFLFIRLSTDIYGEALLHPLILSLAVFETALGALLFQWKNLSKFFNFEKYALLIFCATFIFILNIYGFFTFLPQGPHIGLVLISSTILFLTFGFIIAKLLSSESKKRLQVYFFDLLGGTIGISAFFIISNLFSISYSLIFFEVIIILLFIAYAHYQRLLKVLLTSLFILGCIPLIGNQENLKTLCRYFRETQEYKFDFTPFQTHSNSFSKIHLMKINPQHLVRLELPPLEIEKVKTINKSTVAVIDCTGCSFGFNIYDNKELTIYDNQLSSMPFFTF